ncbi:unnamed protein product, partial [marine sediment metagenome]
VKEHSELANVDSAGYRENHCFEVRKVNKHNSEYVVAFPEGGGSGWYSDTIRKATSDEIAMYKDAGEPVDITDCKTSKLDDDDLLERARRLYPVGTKYIDAHGDCGEQIVDSKPDWVTTGKSIEGGIGYLYRNGVWAEIINGFEHGELLYGEAHEEWLWFYNSKGGYSDSHVGAINFQDKIVRSDVCSIWSGNTKNIRRATTADIQRLTDLGYEVKDYKFVKIKNVKEWGVGTYAVVIKDGYLGHDHCLNSQPKMPIGFVGEIEYCYDNSTTAFM